MSKIINIKPTINPDGYFQDNIDISVSQNKNLLKKISEIKAINIFSNLDNEILQIIVNNHKKLFDNKPLLENEFMVNAMEINELKSIEEKNFSRYLLYRYKYRFYAKKKIIGEYPPCLQIEPTSICNFRCVMCYQTDKSFSNKSNGFMSNMSLDLYKKLIDEVEGKVEAITLASRGEPTLNKDFKNMLEYSNGKFLALKINTNASMLNEKLIHSILSTDIQSIVFSADAADKETYEKIRVNGKFEKIMENLELFAEIRKKHYSKSKHIVKMSGVKISEEQSLEKMEKQFKKYADVIAFVNYTPWQSSYENEPNKLEHACEELWTRMFVWSDGKVNPCDYDYKSLLSKWNAKNTTISEIWNSEEYNLIRQKHIEKKRNTLEPCVRCLN
jgi:MoaA/NifB/PqqE/SkfB family radical SAM enzyme